MKLRIFTLILIALLTAWSIYVLVMTEKVCEGFC